MSTSILLSHTRRHLFDRLQCLGGQGTAALESNLSALLHKDAEWRVSEPINNLTGVAAITEKVWLPLFHALPDLERRDLIFVGGKYQGQIMVAAMGHYCGTFQHNWLGIPATGKTLYIRYGEVYRFTEDKVTQVTCLWDVLDVIRQAGFWPIAPSMGKEGMWPGPITGDGIVLNETDPNLSAASLDQTLAMHRSLASHDDKQELTRASLLTMSQKDYWHPKMMWYGPSGIGTARGLAGFVDHHQLPFRQAFPNRLGGIQWNTALDKKTQYGGGHYINIGDGNYSVTGGWPSVIAQHAGGDFAGMPATGREVTMRVMDFYLHHEGLIRENWVPLDMLHLLKQMGLDVLKRMEPAFRIAAARN